MGGHLWALGRLQEADARLRRAVELAREAVRAFNGRYGETFPEPQAVFSDAPIVKGTDGENKMSKSLGNGIDPLEIVDEYGADALKFTLTFLAAQGQDILIDKETFKLGSKFANLYSG